MSEDRLILAIGRLERALSRVEAAAARPAPMLAVQGHDEAEAKLQSLTERHEKLKQQVETAIDALDRLIEKA